MRMAPASKWMFAIIAGMCHLPRMNTIDPVARVEISERTG